MYFVFAAILLFLVFRNVLDSTMAIILWPVGFVGITVFIGGTGKKIDRRAGGIADHTIK